MPAIRNAVINQQVDNDVAGAFGTEADHLADRHISFQVAANTIGGSPAVETFVLDKPLGTDLANVVFCGSV
jgi:hypothetical protein